MQFAHIDIIDHEVTGGGVDRHQLQLVGIGDGGRVFGQQERTSVARADPPGACATGEVPADERALCHHLSGVQASDARGVSDPHAGGLARGLGIPKTSGDVASVGAD